MRQTPTMVQQAGVVPPPGEKVGLVALPPNDPPADSLFEKVSADRCRCKVCGTEGYNSTEARDGHLAEAEFSDDPVVAAKHRALYTDDPAAAYSQARGGA